MLLDMRIFKPLKPYQQHNSAIDSFSNGPHKMIKPRKIINFTNTTFFFNQIIDLNPFFIIITRTTPIGTLFITV